jgi:ribonucleoside-diphosphate reductase alpha chain
MSNAIATESSQIVDLFKGSVSNSGVTMTSEGREAGRWTRIFTKDNVHPFDDIKWKVVDACIVKSDGSIAFEQKNVEVPAWWTQNNINVVVDKYFRIVNGVRESSFKQVISRVCTVIKAWAKEQNYFETDEDAKIYEEELIHVILHQYGAFNSPVWFNIGISDRAQAASACFISAVEDDLDSIMDFQKSEVNIFRGGSGSGVNISNLRSSYEKITSGSYTSGPLSWMEGLDKYAKAMKSGGSTRNAAKIIVMDMDHPDILETRDGRPGFVKCKSWSEQMAHDLINAGYGTNYDDPCGAYKIVPYQNANHSVSVPDAFMKAVEDDREWETRERLTGKIVHTYKAREVWDEIANAAWMCGDPGVQFTDTINAWHTTPANGRIRSSNPCAEFLNIDNTACNLCAINLTKFFDGRKFLRNYFDQSVRLFVTAQNAMIFKASYPTKEISDNSCKLRPIGLNYGNLGSLLMNLGYGYDSDEGRAVAARLASFMTGTAYLFSSKLAARIGSFQEFDRNRESMLGVIRMHVDADSKILERWNLKHDPLSDRLISDTNDLWNNVTRSSEKYGFANSQVSLMAPLGTVSFMMGMSTTGIEPAFSLVSYKKLVGGGSMKMINTNVNHALKNFGYSVDETDRICKFIEDNDCIEGSVDLKSDHLPVFDCAMTSGPSNRCISPMGHLKMMAAIQPLITCAQSKTVNLPENTTASEIANIYFQSWKLGIKCVALYRNGCKWSQPLSTKKESPEVKIAAPVSKRRHMPEDRAGKTHKFEISGYKGYITVNDYDDGAPGEVFVRLGKNGSTMAGLMDAFTRLLSIALQYNVPLDAMIHSFVNVKFEPSGITRNREIGFVDSPIDYLFKLLDLRYYDGEHSGLAERRAAIAAHSIPPSPDTNSSEPPPPSSKRSSIDGAPCNRCGGITQRSGSCYICTICGTTTGCS